MAFGLWFEQKEDKSKIRGKLTLLVDEAMDFLSPSFGIDLDNEEFWDRVDLPEVQISDSAGYLDNIIYLPKNVSRRDASIGHEVGHWFHDVLNPEIFPLRKDPYVGTLMECVGCYAGLFYSKEEEPVQNPAFKIIDMVKMDPDKINFNRFKINRFYNQLIRRSCQLALEEVKWQNNKN